MCRAPRSKFVTTIDPSKRRFLKSHYMSSTPKRRESMTANSSTRQ